MKKGNNIISVLYVLIAGIMWGSIGLFVRRLNTFGFESMEIVCIRSISGALMMACFLFIYDRSLFRVRLRDIWCFIGTGVVSLTFFNICYFSTLAITSLSVAAILLYTAPSMVMIMSVIIFKEKLTFTKIISVIIAFVGCVFVTGVIGSGDKVSVAGILLGLGSGLGYALYSIFARFALDKGYSSLTVTFYTFLFSVLGSLVFFKPHRFVTVVGERPSIVVFFLLFGLVSTALPYIFYTLGLTGMESGRASVIASIEPVTATILGIVAFGEKMTLMSAVGIMLVLISIMIVNLPHKGLHRIDSLGSED